MIKVEVKDHYCVVRLSYDVFIKIPSQMIINDSTKSEKLICANDDEIELLKTLDVEVLPYCDYYKCVLE